MHVKFHAEIPWCCYDLGLKAGFYYAPEVQVKPANTDTDPRRLLIHPKDRPGPNKMKCATKVIERKSKSKHMEQINHKCFKSHSLQRTVNSHQSYDTTALQTRRLKLLFPVTVCS